MAEREKKSTPSKTTKKVDHRKKAAEAAKRAVGASSDHLTGHMNGFLDFIRSQGVIGLAVGLAIGAAAGEAVKAIVVGFINPIVQFIVGTGTTLSSATWTFEAFGRTATFAWGAAVSALITLLATALVIYWIVFIFKLEKLDKKKS